jgi:hypothetical protein
MFTPLRILAPVLLMFKLRGLTQANQMCCKSGKAAVCVAATSVTTLSGKSANCDKEADEMQNAQVLLNALSLMIITHPQYIRRSP